MLAWLNGCLLGVRMGWRLRAHPSSRPPRDYACSSLVEAAGHCPTVPEPVQAYIGEVQECLRYIANCEG